MHHNQPSSRQASLIIRQSHLTSALLLLFLRFIEISYAMPPLPAHVHTQECNDKEPQVDSFAADLPPPTTVSTLTTGTRTYPRCKPSEFQGWGTQEDGCDGLLTVSPGDCVCSFGLYRRASDGACVEKSSCPASLLWSSASTRVAHQVASATCPVNEELPSAANGQACPDVGAFNNGNCVCKKGFFRRADGNCATTCRKGLKVEVPSPSCKDDEMANQLCSGHCPTGRTPRRGWFCTPPVPGKENSITCIC